MRKLRNISRNAPQAAVVIFTIALGLVFLTPAYLTLKYLIGTRVPEEYLFLAAAALVLGAAPAASWFVKAQQYVVTRPKQAARKPYTARPAKRVVSAAARETAVKPRRAEAPRKSDSPKPEISDRDRVEERDAAVQSQIDQSARFLPISNVSTTFDDIAGYARTKESMAFVVKCLRHPDLLREAGARIPAGILLYGPPGTGKTLMAKAIAGTAGVNFYSANASEFVNVWVGLGAQNVRSLYQAAKENAPSIVFIDELDAIGGVRTSGQNQEYRQTLNALLTEIDGMAKDSGVLTIAATNDFENLDPALIRPGRFDRKIIVPLPNAEDRLAIIRLYAAKHHMSGDISLEKLAKETTGMSGSALATLFNEASIKAVMDDRSVISRWDLDEAMTQMLTNGEASKAPSPEDLKIAAYHEAGHAMILRLLAGDSVQKVSIIGNTIGAVGLTMHSNEDERQLVSLETIRARIVAAYGGRAAEEIVFGKENVTTGARQDIRTASEYIRDYLDYGAGDSLLHESAFAGGRVTPDLREARTISSQLYAEAVEFLSQHRESLDRIAGVLMERETLLGDELDQLLSITHD